MILVGMKEEMNAETEPEWKEVTAIHIQNYFNDEFDDISDLTVVINIEKQTFVKGSRRSLRGGRSLQEAGKLIINYSQSNIYTTTESEYDVAVLAKEAFGISKNRDDYISELQKTSTPEFESLQSVEVNIADATKVEPEDEDEVEEEEEGGNTLVVALVVLVVGLVIIVMSRRSKEAAAKGTEDAESESEGDDVGEQPEEENNAMGGTDPSPGTGDKSDGGGADATVENALGSAATAAEDDEEDDRTDKNFLTPAERAQLSNDIEELGDIYAPPGKLGVVIDKPDDVLVIHAVQETSVIVDKLLVGDRLVAVDDEDVRSMDAIEVSTLIGRKSGNPTRKLSVLRTIPKN